MYQKHCACPIVKGLNENGRFCEQPFLSMFFHSLLRFTY
uniref:Uncharacterized protein n=1 Tax=Anguilla anguilla TaxID=7936 RepID=A0A0E9QY59_ANGAN